MHAAQRSFAAALVLTLLLVPGMALAHGKGHVKGTIKAVAEDHIEVTTEDGKTQTIKRTKDTHYRVGEAHGSAKDAKVGSRVVVHLADDGSAAEVHLPKAP
jgi:hypothetical protein